MKKIIFLSIAIILIAGGKTLAAGPIIINEVAWMGTINSSYDEWIELKNISNQAINLQGWQLIDKTEQIKIVFGPAILAPGDFYLLERTNDNSVPNIAADLIFSGAINDTEESLKLFNAENSLVDEARTNADGSWPAGNKNERRSMERLLDLSWSTYNGSINSGVLGTPKQENSVLVVSTFSPTPIISATPSLTPISTITSTPVVLISEPTPLVADFSTTSPTTQKTIINLIINEFIPNPEGSDEENEWIEIYNAGDNEVDLSGWKIQDASGKAYTFKEEKILAKNYLVLYRPKTKITINNDAETLSLIAPQGETASQISFSGGSKEGYSFARFGPNDWRWTEILTPGKENQFSAESQQKSFAASPSPSTSLKIPYTNPESLGSFKKIVLPAIAIGAIFSLAALIFIKKFIP